MGLILGSTLKKTMKDVQGDILFKIEDFTQRVFSHHSFLPYNIHQYN